MARSKGLVIPLRIAGLEESMLATAKKSSRKYKDSYCKGLNRSLR
jgi:hypothetical protein